MADPRHNPEVPRDVVRYLVAVVKRDPVSDDIFQKYHSGDCETFLLGFSAFAMFLIKHLAKVTGDTPSDLLLAMSRQMEASLQ
jgi:hypothetical protein